MSGLLQVQSLNFQLCILICLVRLVSVVLVVSLKHVKVNKMITIKFNAYNYCYDSSFSDELM